MKALVLTGKKQLEIEDIKEHNGEVVLWIKCKGHTEKDEYVKLSNIVLHDIKNIKHINLFNLVIISPLYSK